MTVRGYVRVVLILLLVVSFLNTLGTLSMVDDTPIPNTVYNQMTESQLTDINFLSVDSLKLGSDYINMDRWSLAISGNYLYMGSSYTPNDAGKMIIVDISDPTNLVEAGRVNHLGECRQLVVVENIAYYADDNNGLWIFNVSDPQDITVLGQYPISAVYDVSIDNQIAYLVALSDDLIILNVTDPSNPYEIGSYSTTIYMTRILVHDDYAYIATREALEIVDVSDPSSPSLIGSAYSDGYKSHIYLKDDFVFITFPARRMRLYNVTDPTNPVELEEYVMSNGIAEIEVVGTLVFTTSNVLGLQVFHLNDYSTTSDIGRFIPDAEARAVIHNEGYFYLVDSHSELWCLEHDCDEDELYSREEYEIGTQSDNPDSDFDLIPDGWEVQNGLNPLVHDSQQDNDEDDLSALEEYLAGTSILTNDTDSDSLSDSAELLIYGTDPLNLDSDFDQMPDGWEVLYALNPLSYDGHLDQDMDDLSNLLEFQYNTDPTNSDSDFDQLPDGWEVQYFLNPLANDTHLDPDFDTLDNLLEYEIGTNPTLDDSDQDGFLDSWEYNNGFDPLNPVVGLSQYLVSIPGWLFISILVAMGLIAVFMIRRRYIVLDTYEGYPYDGTSSRG